MQSSPAAENRSRALARIVVQERPATAQFVLEVGEARAGALLPFVVLAPHGQCQPIAGRDDERGRPALDRELDFFSRLQLPLGVVAMVRSPGRGNLRVQLAVR